jgi:hypothetical protein
LESKATFATRASRPDEFTMGCHPRGSSVNLREESQMGFDFYVFKKYHPLHLPKKMKSHGLSLF